MPIFDQGYQHWSGSLSGHSWRWLTITRHGVRVGKQSRLLRLLVIASWFPAAGLAFMLCLWGLLEQKSPLVAPLMPFLSGLFPREVIAEPTQYRGVVWTVCYHFFLQIELPVAMVVVLLVGPGLISQDLRFNALPLYFSRPLRRSDYFLGKLGVIGSFLLATAVGPAVGAYVLGVAFSLDLGVVRDTHRLLWASTLYGLVITLSAGTLMLALSSLSRRSIYVGLAWAGFCFLTLMLSGILMGIQFDTERRQVVYGGLMQWVRDHPPPSGIELVGPYPRRGPGAPDLTRDEAAQRWLRAWSETLVRLHLEAEAGRAENSRTDWRPVVSYATNLDRLGDWLLDADGAWVALGRAVERPRAAFGPAIRLQTRGRAPAELTGPANDRFLADRIVWQYPWYWSAAALGGLWLASVAVLTRRVRSLDRLR
jgi:ABC-2 type transport system permease protein